MDKAEADVQAFTLKATREKLYREEDLALWFTRALCFYVGLGALAGLVDVILLALGLI